MLNVPALLLALLLPLDHYESLTDATPGIRQMPSGIELKARQDVRIPWSEKAHTFAAGPYRVDMASVIAKAELRALEPEAEPPVLEEKGRIPGAIPPELDEILRLEAWSSSAP